MSVNAGGVQYFYDAQNKRMWQATCTAPYGSCFPTNGSSWVLATESVVLFGADGKQVGTYAPGPQWNPATLQPTQPVGMSFGGGIRTYFGGKLVGQGLMPTLAAVVQDRLGSVGKYYPYGEERNAPQLPNDQVKFATYTRDAATGNDYADQRYYSSVLGRFMTPDPYKAGTGSGDPKMPQSWNHFAYAAGDPINFNDPSGRFWCDPDDPSCIPGCDPTDPECYPYPPPPPLPPEYQQTITESCDVSVFAQPIPGLPGGVHTFIETTATISVNGNPAVTVYNFYQATPEVGDPPVACTQEQAALGQCWLNDVSSRDTIIPAFGGGRPPAVGRSAKKIWDSGPSTGECDNAFTIDWFERRYPNNTFHYVPPLQTSNSFTYTLLTLGGIPTGQVLAGAIANGFYFLPVEGWGDLIPILP